MTAIRAIAAHALMMLMMTTTTLTLGLANSGVIKNTKGCPEPESPVRGSYRMSADGTAVEFFCEPGQSLVGTGDAVCSNGLWSSPPPICVGGDCEKPVVKYGSMVSMHGGGIIRIQCRKGYVLRAKSEFIACIDGEWNATQPNCTTAAEQEQQPVKQSSLVGVKQWKPEEVSKRTHKEWLASADYSCVRQDFTVYPPTVPNARAFTRWAVFDGQPRLYTTYQCKWGFKPTAAGTKNVYCHNGEWIGSVPKCQAVVSDEPSQGDFPGGGVARSLSHEELLLRADYSCIDARPGASRDPPAMDNSPPPTLKFAILEGQPHLYAEYACNDGFQLASEKDAYMYCKMKTWIGNKPRCVEASKESCARHNGGCNQLCSPGDHGQPVCSCKPGYYLQEDRRTCADFDECEVNSGDCDHLCDNTSGSFECSCFPGYAIQPDGKSCTRIQEDSKDEK